MLLLCDAFLRIAHSSNLSVLSLLGGSAAIGRTLFDMLAQYVIPVDHPLHLLLQGSSLSDEQEHSFLLASADNQTSVHLHMHASTAPDGPRSWLVCLEEDPRQVQPDQETGPLLLDSLTGLGTRELLRNEAEHTIDAALVSDRRIALILIDLDRFKTVNGTLGHPVGDVLLRTVARRLLGAVRSGDIVVRLSGDKFAILLRGAGAEPEPAADVASRIIELIRRPFLVHGNQIDIGASVGIALSPAHAVDWEILFQNADLALYQSKNAGGSRYSFFTSAIALEAHNRRTLEMDLRKALPLQQLEVYYQPQMAFCANQLTELIGFEALLRWHHPERGFISPAEFIPLAEQLGLIVPIGEWVLRTACEHARNWPADLCIAVNVSPVQFDSDNLVQAVREALESTGLPGHRLELEITEGVLLRCNEKAMGVLNEIKALGVRIAMDDFGTGYASLSQLASFPFDRIKIDQSFIRDAGNSRPKQVIVKAIAALGASMGFDTVAEGVETQEQLDRILADGCDTVQGFFFSRPVPSHEVKKLIENLTNPTQLAPSSSKSPAPLSPGKTHVCTT